MACYPRESECSSDDSRRNCPIAKQRLFESYQTTVQLSDSQGLSGLCRNASKSKGSSMSSKCRVLSVVHFIFYGLYWSKSEQSQRLPMGMGAFIGTFSCFSPLQFHDPPRWCFHCAVLYANNLVPHPLCQIANRGDLDFFPLVPNARDGSHDRSCSGSKGL
mmetsp:Transcript_26411/g.61868  ORF Transcript_26411/g.61868 Transcript_26411/m.61868 type:complete len:161 (+) Transcript_26411:262-744(+)